MAETSDAEIRERLFRNIRKQRDGMLGLVGSELQHPQPMTTYVDTDNERPLYFFARSDSDLVTAVEAGNTNGLYVFVDEDRDLFASMLGTLTASRDQAIIDKFWNPIVAAWYPDGNKEDPRLRVLTFLPDDAQVWLNQEGPVKFMFEVAKANATNTEPDVGQRTELKF